MNKFDISKIASIVGMALGFAGTVVSSIASDKKMKNEVAKQVSEAVKNLK